MLRERSEMKKKVATGMMLTLVILSILTFSLNVEPVKAEPKTIHVPTDCSTIQEAVDAASPGDTIYVYGGIYYENVIVNKAVSLIGENRSFTIVDGGETGNVFSIIRDNVSIKGFTIKNSGPLNTGIHLDDVNDCNITENDITDNYYGFRLDSSSNNTITGNNIKENNWEGIRLYYSLNNSITENNITANNGCSIRLEHSSNNTIAGNNIKANNGCGIYLYYSSNNTITGNNIKANNGCGIRLEHSSNNNIYHNNFVNNARPPASTLNSTNVWDDGYPSGGNYWSDYTGSDFYSGPHQNKPNSDGIGDIPYVIDDSNQDNYPLMEPWTYPRMRLTRYPWSMFRHNLRRTGYTGSPAPNTNQTIWNYTTGELGASSPAVVDGMVFIGFDDGNVYALDQYTGALIWNYTTAGPVQSSPAVVDGKVYIGSGDGKVYCLDALTGSHIWNYTTGAYVRSSPAVADSRVYVGSYDNKTYCLDAATGELIWNYTTGSDVRSSPAVAYGKVYVGSWFPDCNVYCLDALTGALVWNYTTGGGVRACPAVVDGRVYIGSWDNKTYCLDALTGALVWNYTTDSNVYSSPAVAYGKVYVGSWGGKVYCLDALTGSHIWNYTTGDSVESSPAVADGRVYVGSWDNKTYCLDAATGELIWDYTTGGRVWSSPAIADGMLFISSLDGNVYAFGNIVRVPEDYPRIQGAINAATPEATIIIAAGTYYESVVIDKPLTIIGLPGSSTEFQGGGSGIAITLLPSASGTIITGIVVTNWGQGIFFANSSNCKIYGNIMSLMGESGIVLEGKNAANNLIYNNIFQGNNVAINLTKSSTSNIIYHNNFVNNTNPVYVSPEVYANIWDNGYPSGGNYWSDYSDVDLNSDGIWDHPYVIDADNIDRYPLVKPFRGLAITKATTPKTVIGQGFTLRIDVTILNHGVDDEVSTITIHANTTVKASLTVTLTNRDFTKITLTWNTSGVAKGNYTMTARVTPVPDETDTTDNTYTDGWIIVAMVSDITGPDGWPDGKCDMRDIGMVARLFGVNYPDPRYNPNCDVIYDLKIDMKDVGTVARHFGEVDP